MMADTFPASSEARIVAAELDGLIREMKSIFAVTWEVCPHTSPESRAGSDMASTLEKTRERLHLVGDFLDRCEVAMMELDNELECSRVSHDGR